MADQEKDEAVRAEIIKQAIIFAFGIATLVVWTLGQRELSNPDFVPTIRQRLGIGRDRDRNPDAEALAQVRKEISWMEHCVG
jgi:hypothetical protein